MQDRSFWVVLGAFILVGAVIIAINIALAFIV